MQVILLQDIEKVGDANTIVTVTDGYGLNFLLPNKLAVIATAGEKKILETRVKEAEARDAQILAELKALADRIKGNVIRVAAKAGTSGKIFGSVTNVQLAAAMKEQIGVELERKNIELPDDVKMLGTYTATAHLHKKMAVAFEFEVFNDDNED